MVHESCQSTPNDVYTNWTTPVEHTSSTMAPSSIPSAMVSATQHSTTPSPTPQPPSPSTCPTRCPANSSPTTPTSLLPCVSVYTADEPCTDTINFVVEVKNTGSTDGNHTVLLYSRPLPEVADAPMKQLVGYLKAFVPANQSANLTSPSMYACKALAPVDRTAYVVLPAGNHTI